jgi:predicted N-acetyltransferase YhbS
VISVSAAEIRVRQAESSDVAACAELRTRAIEAYRTEIGIGAAPPDHGALSRLMEHLRQTDPDGFVVATTRTRNETEAIVAMGIAMQRARVWFLSALYVDASYQAHGLGSRLFRQLLKSADKSGREGVLATCTDCLQPISNALYSRAGIVPRVPMFQFSGRGTSNGALRVSRVDATPIPETSSSSWAHVRGRLSAIDRSVLGFERPEDHEFFRRESAHAWLFADGGGAPSAYAYMRRDGLLGPIAATRDEMLFDIVHTIETLSPLGRPASFWLSGTAADTFEKCLDFGFKLEGVPALACWSRPFADFSRYVPWNLTLL